MTKCGSYSRLEVREIDAEIRQAEQAAQLPPCATGHYGFEGPGIDCLSRPRFDIPRSYRLHPHLGFILIGRRR